MGEKRKGKSILEDDNTANHTTSALLTPLSQILSAPSTGITAVESSKKQHRMLSKSF
jgi:hypothetical protein